MSDDKKLKRKQKKFLKTADQISKNQDKRRAGENVNQNQQDRKFKKLNKTADQVSKLRKNKTSTPINYGTMKNSINKQFSMNPGSKEVDTQGTFKNDAAVLNMGTPTNYGTPIKKHEPGHEGLKPKKKLPTDGMTVEEKLEYYKNQRENSKKQKNSSIKMGIGSNRSSGKNILG
jgi:hypothetical protein